MNEIEASETFLHKSAQNAAYADLTRFHFPAQDISSFLERMGTKKFTNTIPTPFPHVVTYLIFSPDFATSPFDVILL